jgi:hypothetical protein
MARRTIRIVSGEDLTGEQYAGRGNSATVNDLNGRQARHGARRPWR